MQLGGNHAYHHRKVGVTLANWNITLVRMISFCVHIACTYVQVIKQLDTKTHCVNSKTTNPHDTSEQPERQSGGCQSWEELCKWPVIG